MPDRAYIAIEGPIGVGKTTLARMLQPEFGAELLFEIFEENPFLSDFYADRQRFAFQTQIFFLLSRYHQQREVHRVIARQTLISDYTFAKDRLFAHLNLHGDELETYERLHSALGERVASPDLIVYLRAAPETLMERIATRDRPYERTMSPEYIAALSDAYEQFYAGYPGGRLLTVDTDSLNVVGNPADLRYIIGRVREALAGIPSRPVDAATEGAPFARPVVGLSRSQAAAVDRAEGDLQLYLEVLDLQRAVGELAAALLRAPARRPGHDGPSTLQRALEACQRSLGRIGESVGSAGAEAPLTRSGEG